jgi:hypothetical protein
VSAPLSIDLLRAEELVRIVSGVINRPTVLVMVVMAILLAAHFARMVVEVLITLADVGLSNVVRNWISKRRREDFLPLSLTVLGVAISAGAIWWGLAAPPGDFLLNVLAALALLGPGLVITNVLVARVDSLRAKEEAETRTAPLLYLLLLHFNEFILMGNDYLEMITAEIQRKNPQATGFAPMEMADTLPDALSKIGLMNSSVTYLDADPPPGIDSRRLPLLKSLEFPDARAVLHVVERIDRDIPMPLAMFAAQKMVTWSERVGLDFYDRRKNMRIFDPNPWVYVLLEPTKVGFAEIGAYAYPPDGSDSHEERYVDIVKYAECLMTTFARAEMLLKLILSEVPKENLPEQLNVA